MVQKRKLSFIFKIENSKKKTEVRKKWLFKEEYI